MTEEIRPLIEHLRTVPGFPKPGINFVDITPILQDAAAFQEAIGALEGWARTLAFDVVVAPEARGFILGAPLADRLGKGFVPVRKPGKLPWKVEQGRYELEYGEAALEIHTDAIPKGARAIVVDDLLATGGTARAAADLVTALGGCVLGAGFLVELTFLDGRSRFGDIPVFAALPVGEA